VLPVPQPARQGYTSLTEVPLYWCSYGSVDAPRLLVLHGGPGAHHEYLLPQFLRLADRFQLVFYDQRGGGRSRHGDGAVTWLTHVKDLARLARELDLEPLALVGYSWGGLLALLYATEQLRSESLPSVRLLVAIDPAPVTRPYRQEFEQEFARRMRSDSLRQLREELATSGLRERDPESYRRRQFELAVAPYFARPELATELTPFRVSGKVQQSVWASLGDYDAVSSAASLRIPALVVHGRHDPIPLRSSQEVADAMRARFLVLENSGHVPFIEQPDALFTAVEQFLEDYILGG